MKIKYKIRILYKSGNSFEGWFKRFDISHNNGSVTKVSWDRYKVRPMFMELGNIEAIFIISEKILIWDTIKSLFSIDNKEK